MNLYWTELFEIELFMYIFLSRWIILYIELPRPKSPANTARDIQNHWTAISTL